MSEYVCMTKQITLLPPQISRDKKKKLKYIFKFYENT